MVAPTRGLTPTDLGAVREALTAGRRPRVVFTESAGQIAGQVGQVVSIADPATSDEYIVVRFGKDELPFAAHDLAMPARGRSARLDAQQTAVTVEAKAPVRRAESAAKARSTPMPTTQSQATQSHTMGKAKLERTPVPVPRNDFKPAAGPAAPANTPPQNGSANRPESVRPEAPPRPAKVRAPASLIVTLSYADREWTVAATLGSRAIVKPHPIRPTDALRMVALVDAPGLHDAVQSIIAAERVEAENRAQRLRAELAEIESRLSELVARS